jgi:methyl-accepting chemotaxis protein
MVKGIKGSIRNKILLIPIVVIVVIAVIVTIYFPQNKAVELKRTLADQIDITADLLSYGFGIALEAADFEAMTQAYETIKSKDQISYVLIFDETNSLINAYNPKNYVLDTARTSFSKDIIVSNKFIEKATTIKTVKAVYGTVVVGISLDGIKKQISRVIWLSIGVSILFLIIFGLITVFLTNRIITPIHSVVASVTALGNGDLTHTCTVMSNDETADIANALNNTIKSVAEMVKRIKDSSGVIAQKAKAFSETADNISKNAVQTSQKTSQSAQSATSATESLKNVSSSTEDMSTSIGNVTNAIEQMSLSINEVSKNCQSELTIANEASMQAKDAIGQMEHLKNINTKVALVLDVIKTVSNSINLLALNATIEAAIAGNAGKGFAIVANEVKALSVKTKKSVDEIQKLIKEISESSSNAVNAVTKISTVIDEINTYSQTIVSAVEQQSMTIQNISRDMSLSNDSAKSTSQNVKDSVSNISKITELIVDVDQNASETASRVSEIKESTVLLTRITSDLNETVGHFKLP